MKTKKLVKIIIAAIVVLFGLGIVISAGVYVNAGKKVVGRYYSEEIENLKHLKQTAKYLYKHDEWDTEFAGDIFGTYPNPAYDPLYPSYRPERITNEYEDVIRYIDASISNAKTGLYGTMGVPVALLLLGLAMFLSGGVTLATCFVKGKGEAQSAEEESEPKKKDKKGKGKKQTPPTTVTYETTAPAAPAAPAAPIAYLECPACHGKVPAIAGQAVITCEQCGAAYRNPYMK